MATFAEIFLGGVEAGQALNSRLAANVAATQQFGPAAGNPGLFQALNNIEQGKAQETRAQSTFDQRTAATATATATRERDRVREAALNLTQGLRSARDGGRDVGTTFDTFVANGTFDLLGVSQADLPGMRQSVVDNPAFLDDLVTALGGAPVGASSGAGASSGVGANDEAAITAKGAEIGKTIDEMIGMLDKLDELGGVRSDKATSFLDSTSRFLRSSTLGGRIDTAYGTEVGTNRALLDGFRTLLLTSLIQDDSFSAKMFDSNLEKQLWLGLFGRNDLTIQAQVRLLNKFREKFQSGGKLTVLDANEVIAANKADAADTQAPASTGGTDAPVVIYPGYVNPTTGMRFIGKAGDNYRDPTKWEKVN